VLVNGEDAVGEELLFELDPQALRATPPSTHNKIAAMRRKYMSFSLVDTSRRAARERLSCDGPYQFNGGGCPGRRRLRG
jgi:hypothetical protein